MSRTYDVPGWVICEALRAAQARKEPSNLRLEPHEAYWPCRMCGGVGRVLTGHVLDASGAQAEVRCPTCNGDGRGAPFPCECRAPATQVVVNDVIDRDDTFAIHVCDECAPEALAHAIEGTYWDRVLAARAARAGAAR